MEAEVCELEFEQLPVSEASSGQVEHEARPGRSHLSDSTCEYYLIARDNESNVSYPETEDSIALGGDAHSLQHRVETKCKTESEQPFWSRKYILWFCVLLFLIFTISYTVSKARQVQDLSEIIQKLQNNVTELQRQLVASADVSNEEIASRRNLTQCQPGKLCQHDFNLQSIDSKVFGLESALDENGTQGTAAPQAFSNESCTCTPKKTLGYSLLAGVGTCAVTAGIALIPGVGQAAALGAVLSAGEMAAAGLLGAGTFVGTGAVMRGTCNC